MASYMRFCYTVLILSLVVTGCGTRRSYVMVRNVPKSPTFAVFPNNQGASELDYAEQIEHAIMGNGVSVKHRPQVKRREVLQVERAPTELFEGFQVSSDYADYFVFTDVRNHRVKIVKSATQEVLAIFYLKPGHKTRRNPIAIDHYPEVVGRHLEAMGIPVVR